MNTDIILFETFPKFLFVSFATAIALLIFNAIASMFKIRKFYEKQPEAEQKQEVADPPKKKNRRRKPTITIKELNENTFLRPELPPFAEDNERKYYAFQSGKGFRYAALNKGTDLFEPLKIHPETGKRVLPVIEEDVQE